MAFLLGRKVGMTRLFAENGSAVPVTLIEAGPCQVVQRKTVAKDGYSAIQVGLGTARQPAKPQAGHAAHCGLENTPQVLQEFRIADEDMYAEVKELRCTDFQIGHKVKITSTSKGKGFAGVIKRHNFHRGPETHGHDHHRAPGSIGSMFPQHVMKGKRMPGKMGAEQVSVRNLEVVDVLPEQNLIAIKGAIPGTRGAVVAISSL